jgi:radical SAM protein with 4Fe4S-binding SPASM domain
MCKWNIGWGTVSDCNMSCQFCYSDYRRKDMGNLSLEEWKQFIDNNHNHIGSINYGTGENTLSNDWFKLVAYIRCSYPDIRQALTTNGYLAEGIKIKKNLDAFISGIDEVDVSLDFADKKKHSELRGQVKAYDWAIETLKLCQEYCKLSTIVFLGSKVNLYKENIDGIFKIAKRYNAILRMNIYRPTEGINDTAKKFIVDYDTLRESLLYIADKYKVISLGDSLFSNILSDEPRVDPSGDRSIRILSNGSITPSTYLISKNYIVGNIKDENILERLATDGRLSKIIHKVLPEECNECIYAEKCGGGVYDRRYLWYKDLNKRDPYCPGAFKEEGNKIKVDNINFSSIHDGYLPTIFFKNKEL